MTVLWLWWRAYRAAKRAELERRRAILRDAAILAALRDVYESYPRQAFATHFRGSGL